MLAAACEWQFHTPRQVSFCPARVPFAGYALVMPT